MKTIVLVSCSKSKKRVDEAIPAQELYSPSAYFQKQMRVADTFVPDNIYILSAKHHVVELQQPLHYYDMYLGNQPKKYRKEWGQKVLQMLQDKGVNLKEDKIIILCGKDYYENFVDALTNYAIVGKGLSMGKKMQFLDKMFMEWYGFNEK